MTQQRGGSAGFFAVLLGRNPNEAQQTQGNSDSLSRSTDPLSNQLTSAPVTTSKTLESYKAYPSLRVSGQTAFEAAINNVSLNVQHGQNPQRISQEVHERLKNTSTDPYPAYTHNQAETDIQRSPRKVAFNTPSSSVRRVKVAPEGDKTLRESTAVHTSSRTVERGPGTQPTDLRNRSSARPERGELEYQARSSNKSNGKNRPDFSSNARDHAVSRKGSDAPQHRSGADRKFVSQPEPTRGTRDERDEMQRRAYLPSKTDERYRLSHSSSDRIQQAAQAIARKTGNSRLTGEPDRAKPLAPAPKIQEKPRDALDPPPRRPVPSFLPPVASTAGVVAASEEPKARIRSNDRQDRETPRGSRDLSRRSRVPAEQIVSKHRPNGSRPASSPIKEHRDRGTDEADRLYRERSSSSRPSHLHNNQARNPLSSESGQRPIGRRG